jgi:sugar lactone lactonase YvrE
MNKLLITLSIIALTLANCTGGNRKSEAESIKKFELTEAWRTDTLLLTSESVIYDKKRAVLYVTNLNMEPRQKDANGFVSRVSTDGKITDLHWVDGMHAPKGTAIVGDTLYVADIDELIVIDINKGEIARKVPATGAGMLNDITSDSEGNLYISDSDANKILKYSKGILTDWLSNGLNLPNGLLAENNRLLLASMGSMDLVSIDLDSKSASKLADSLGAADGISFIGIKDYYIVTDWNGEIFMVNPDKTRTSLLKTSDKQINTADCEYIAEKKLLLVPSFFKNSVIAYSLSEKKE